MLYYSSYSWVDFGYRGYMYKLSNYFLSIFKVPKIFRSAIILFPLSSLLESIRFYFSVTLPGIRHNLKCKTYTNHRVMQSFAATSGKFLRTLERHICLATLKLH